MNNTLTYRKAESPVTEAGNSSFEKNYAQKLACHKALMNAISESVFSTDASFVIQCWNKASEKIYQVAENHAVGKVMHEVINFTVVHGSFEQALEVISRTGTWAGEVIILCPDGKELPIQASINAIRNDEGELIGYVAAARDMTEMFEANAKLRKERLSNIQLKKAKDSLTAMQNQFNAFMDHNPAMSWIVDDEGIFHYFNTLYLKTFQLSPAHIGRHVREIFPADVAEEYLRNNAIVFETGKPIEVTEMGEEPGGKRTMYKVLKFPLNLPGHKKYQGGIAVDISSELQKQQELSLSNERFRLVNKATSDLIWDWDIVADEILKGETFERHRSGKTTGCYTIEDSLKKIYNKDRDRIRQSLWKAIADTSAQYWTEEYRVATENGRIKSFIDKAYIIRDASGKAIRMIGALHNITEKKELQHKLLEQEKNRQREMVKAAMDAQEKERHEIAYELHDNVNQLLTTCKLQLEAAEFYAHDKNYLSRISSFMQNIIDEIRAITHQLNPSNIETAGLVPSIEDLASKINATGKLKLDFCKKKIDVADRFQRDIELVIFRIVQEQVQNIIKHAAATHATISLEKNKGQLCLHIADNGKGFDPGDTGKGLGLINIVNRAEYYGGTVTIKTSKGRGCKISVNLPY